MSKSPDDSSPDFSSPVYSSVDELLAAARSKLDRVDAEQARAAVADGARIVDIRPAWQRQREGEIAGSLIVERNHLEWRLSPTSAAALPAAAPGQRWVVVCSEGYTSSLAAAALCSLGVPATDLIGGVRGWRDAGLPLVAGPTRDETVVTDGSRVDLGDLGGPDVEDEPTH